MRTPSRPLWVTSTALAAAVVCAVFVGGSAANAADRDTPSLGFSVIAAVDPAQPVIIVPTIPPDPLPTVDPVPTDDPAPSEPPVETPDPTVPPTPDPEPTVDPPAPTEDPAPVETVAPEVPVTEAPAPVEPSEEPSDDSDDSDDSGADDETATPVPTETATVAPAPIVTATAAPAPVIELPFYPPPSAGTAHDTFPFAFAGAIGALVLLLGVATYFVTRYRLRRLRSVPGAAPWSSGRTAATTPSASGAAQTTSAFARRLTSGTALSSLALPWASETRSTQKQGVPEPTFELGFGALATPVDARPDTSLLKLGFGSVAGEARTAVDASAPSFDLGFAPSARAQGTAASAPEPDDLLVFTAPPPASDPSLLQRFRLSFGSKASTASTASTSVAGFDLGLPSTS